MPGENCCVYGCSTSRDKTHIGTGIFKLPSAKLYKGWRANWLNELTKYRVADQTLKEK
jgi:hypothetical protein